MAAPRLDISEVAQNDLVSIASYIAEQSGRRAAEIVAARIDKSMRNLAFMPGIGGRRAYVESTSRIFAVSSWMIVYEILPESGGIFVQRVIDGRRDLSFVLRKP